MKTLIRYWWTGMVIISIGSLPVQGMFSLLNWLEPELVDGHRPLWWRIVGTAIAFTALVVLPVIVYFMAQPILRVPSLPAHKDVRPTA